jgi:hypothetical protein
MTSPGKFLGAAVISFAAAVPAAAQYNPYPTPQYQYPAYPGQQYPQQYPQYPQQYPPQYPQTYPGQPYGYGQNPVTDIIDQLLGNRYSVSDRQAVRQCARAAVSQAAAQYGGGGYGNGGYDQGYNRGYGGGLRVTAITDVQRRPYGLRVSGLMSARGGYGGQYGYDQGYGYQNQGYAAGQLSFRCNVDYRGAVTGLRIRPANAYRG